MISPLLANIYLHYAFDLWVNVWRKKWARGEVVVIRYADDTIAGFQYQTDADRFLENLRERLAKFGLELHPDKTRRIEFERFAEENRKRRGEGKPETFDFLGFTHISGKNRLGRFAVRRLTIRKRMRSKLREIKQQLRPRMHDPMRQTGAWLRSVVQGPKGKPAGETHAYSLEEIVQMLKVLPQPASTIVAVAAFTGVRKGELRGLLWENYDGEQVLISQSFWRGHALEPKTQQSKAPVPVIAQLARLLDSHRCLSGNPANGLMFVSPVGKPVNLDALAADFIVPLVTKAGVRWRGWHAFRRGLATNLHQLGVSDKTIQRILRHSNVAVTQNCYIKTAGSEVAAAMQQFERSLEYAPNMHLSGTDRQRLM